MERRGQQRVNRKHCTLCGHSAETPGSTTKEEEFKLIPQSNSWVRIGIRAGNKEECFNNLFCHLTVENLREAHQTLDGTKARGVDNITKRQYGKNLEANLKDLEDRIHKGTYRPLPRRQVLIPKANGKMRPIAISAYEDKLVEWTVARILGLVYEPLFINTSYGFRPRRNAYQAVRITYQSLKENHRPYVVEIDLKSFFDTVPQRKLMKLVKLRIADRRFRSLIARFLQAGILQDDGKVLRGDTGTAQGAILSPVLANVYLHYCLDTWFLENYAQQNAVIVRYADDAVFLFKKKEQAEQFRLDLKRQIEEAGLALNEDKSGIVDFGKHKGNVFHILGFTFYWDNRQGASERKLQVKTEKSRLFKKISSFAEWIKETRSKLNLNQIWEMAASKLQGHYTYYGLSCNRPKLNHFYHAAIGCLFKWLNRRSQRKSFTWERFARRLKFKPLPTPPPVESLKQLDRSYVYV